MPLDPSIDLPLELLHLLWGVAVRAVPHFEPGDGFVFDECFTEMRVTFMEALHSLLDTRGRCGGPDDLLALGVDLRGI
jgi:hypothetical protein